MFFLQIFGRSLIHRTKRQHEYGIKRPDHFHLPKSALNDRQIK